MPVIDQNDNGSLVRVETQRRFYGRMHKHIMVTDGGERIVVRCKPDESFNVLDQVYCTFHYEGRIQ